MLKKISVVIGTRPEAIKMAPLIIELRKYSELLVEICCTGQHKTMFDEAFESFGLKANVFMNVMKKGQSLAMLTTKLIIETEKYFYNSKPELVLVHGDTTTAMAASLSSFYQKINIGHVEAGLRTYNIYSPFPEEFNRRTIGLYAKYHYAPTEIAKKNLIKDSINPSNILVTGNTVIDALIFTVNKFKNNDALFISLRNKFLMLLNFDIVTTQFILITAHRRENINDLISICKAFKLLAERNRKIKFIYPVHLNPKIQKIVYEHLSGIENILLIEPLNYIDFALLMNYCRFIITDSGGIQEEAPALGKPVLVIRENSERPEAIAVGTAKLISTNIEKIIYESQKFINDDELIRGISALKNPYGDGKASCRIATHIVNRL